LHGSTLLPTRLWLVMLAVALASGSRAAAAPSGNDLKQVFELAGNTLALVERSEPRPKMAAELRALQKRFPEPKRLGDGQRAALYDRVRALRRRIILSHPALDFDRLLINKRAADIPGHMCDQYLGRHSRPGPGLAVLESWKQGPRARLLVEGKLPPGATHHPDLSFDARRALFAYCSHAERDGKRRSYFIFEVALDTGKVRQLTGTRRDSFAGSLDRQTVLIEDYDPCYLPDGGFAFISTRSQQFGRCHGSRYVPSYVMYRADADGAGLERISFNEANEWDPSVLPDGRVIYCRWDYINRHDTNFQSLWVTRPDGTMVEHYYGNYSVGPCMIAEPTAIPGSRKIVATATDHHGYTAGSIIVIDPAKGQDGGAPLRVVTPEIGFPERSPPKGTTFTPRPLRSDVEPAQRNRRRRAATPFPLTEDLFLVSYPHGERCAIYLIDTVGGRELIYADPKISCFSPIPIRPRPRPAVVTSTVGEPRQGAKGWFVVQDVYQSTQPIERGSIKRLRVSAIISQPTRSKPILSHVNNEIIKRILGTVPVEPDGSVAFEAPADTPLQFQLLDANGMAVMTMRSLVYRRPGEMTGCVGCHEPREDTPQMHQPPSALKFRKLQPPAGPRYDGGFSFVRTVQPVLDRYCIGCHGLEKTEAGVNLTGAFRDSSGKGLRFTASYESIMRRGGMVKIAQRNSETAYSTPKDYYAHAGRLTKMLLDGHPDKAGKPKVRLDRDSLSRIIDWLDLNAQFYGDYSFNRIETQRPVGAAEKALRQAVAKRFGTKISGQPFAALVNLAMPSESRILKAPLAEKAGGWGQPFPRGAWTNTNDMTYKHMAKLVEACVPQLKRHDIAGTCGSPEGKGCRCGCCWVRQVRAERRRKSLASKSASVAPHAR
jgi:hypothetical protein